MRSHCVWFLAALSVLGLWLGTADAKIESLTVDHDGRRVFHVESFGYEPGGGFELSIKSFMA